MGTKRGELRLGSILYCFKTLSFTIQSFIVTCAIDRMGDLQMKRGHRASPLPTPITYDGGKFVLMYLGLAAPLTSLCE